MWIYILHAAVGLLWKDDWFPLLIMELFKMYYGIAALIMMQMGKDKQNQNRSNKALNTSLIKKENVSLILQTQWALLATDDFVPLTSVHLDPNIYNTLHNNSWN